MFKPQGYFGQSTAALDTGRENSNSRGFIGGASRSKGKESVAGLVSRFPCSSGKWSEQERTRKEISQTEGGKETRTRRKRRLDSPFCRQFWQEGGGGGGAKGEKNSTFDVSFRKMRVLEGRGNGEKLLFRGTSREL